MMAVSGGKILVIKNSRCPRWEYMFHDLKSPVCFACCLSRSQHPGETSETRKKLGLSAMLAFWRKEPFLFLFLTLLHLSSASWCLCLLLEILTVVILIPIFEKGLKFFKWFSQGEDENQGFSHSRALFFFNLYCSSDPKNPQSCGDGYLGLHKDRLCPYLQKRSFCHLETSTPSSGSGLWRTQHM